jgi:hypothetical protein
MFSFYFSFVDNIKIAKEKLKARLNKVISDKRLDCGMK